MVTMMKRTRTCLPRIRLLVLVASALLANGSVSAKEPGLTACLPDEPDSVQISWDSPCQDGTWLMDTELGCRMWDWHPAPEDTAFWTGACRAGLKEGRGVVQWLEHGQPIDRFEGSFVAGRRRFFQVAHIAAQSAQAQQAAPFGQVVEDFMERLAGPLHHHGQGKRIEVPGPIVMGQTRLRAHAHRGGNAHAGTNCTARIRAAQVAGDQS